MLDFMLMYSNYSSSSFLVLKFQFFSVWKLYVKIDFSAVEKKIVLLLWLCLNKTLPALYCTGQCTSAVERTGFDLS